MDTAVIKGEWRRGEERRETSDLPSTSVDFVINLSESDRHSN